MTQHTKHSARIEEMIRVDHAGEYAAVNIYRAQRKVFERLGGHDKMVSDLKHMEQDEQDHLDAFDNMITCEGVRPTAMMPFWSIAAHGLGVATALLGEKAAHACTEAVESVIEKHYDDQVKELEANGGNEELAARFARFRDEETAHKEFAVGEGAHEAPAYPLLSGLIKAGCRIAIRVSEKL